MPALSNRFTYGFTTTTTTTTTTASIFLAHRATSSRLHRHINRDGHCTTGVLHGKKVAWRLKSGTIGALLPVSLCPKIFLLSLRVLGEHTSNLFNHAFKHTHTLTHTRTHARAAAWKHTLTHTHQRLRSNTPPSADHTRRLHDSRPRHHTHPRNPACLERQHSTHSPDCSTRAREHGYLQRALHRRLPYSNQRLRCRVQHCQRRNSRAFAPPPLAMLSWRIWKLATSRIGGPAGAQLSLPAAAVEGR